MECSTHMDRFWIWSNCTRWVILPSSNTQFVCHNTTTKQLDDTLLLSLHICILNYSKLDMLTTTHIGIMIVIMLWKIKYFILIKINFCQAPNHQGRINLLIHLLYWAIVAYRSFIVKIMVNHFFPVGALILAIILTTVLPLFIHAPICLLSPISTSTCTPNSNSIF